MRVLVKVCGITRVEDARAAVDLGAAAIGMVFWPRSPRAIDTETARAIVGTLPSAVTAVGVFVNQPADEVLALASEVGLGAVQLHGDEPPDAWPAGVPIIKAVAVAGGGDLDDVLGRLPVDVTVLLDAHDPERRGGTGRAIDWAVAAAAARRRRIVLAGGLRTTNVARAIVTVRPFAIDVSSGVESAPGIKDHDELRRFFDAVHACGDGFVVPRAPLVATPVPGGRRS